MMSISLLPPAKRAHRYLSESDHPGYYHRDESAPSEFIGALAESLGVAGEIVSVEKFNRYLQGDIGGIQVGTKQDDKLRHKPGYDCVFSPDKSISIMAQVAGDIRLIEAHDEAVKTAFFHLQNEAARFRKHTIDLDGASRFEHISTKSLMAATFRHDCNRNLSPHLHTHVAVFNLTQIESGDFRSIEGRHLYNYQKKAGLIYQQALAEKVKSLGYQIEPNDEGYFRIKDVPLAVSNEFSDRSRDINDALKERGLTRKNASSAMKQSLAYATRDKKRYVDKELLREEWLKNSKHLGFDCILIKEQAIKKTQELDWAESQRANEFDLAQSLIKSAIKSIGERKAVFTMDELVDYASKNSVSVGVSRESLILQFNQLLESGELLATKDIKKYSLNDAAWVKRRGFTTPYQIDCERKMLDMLKRSIDKFGCVLTNIEIQKILDKEMNSSREAGFEGWTLGQIEAARFVLLSGNQFVAINGLAGSAKTTTVLKTVATEYRRLGYEVIGMAPSSSACKSLADGACISNVRTVASHLLMMSETDSAKVWLLDEASLVSTKDMLALMKKAQFENARLILVGDRDQLDAVEAGSAFLQLQHNGLPTVEMRDIVRQDNELLLDSIYDSIEGKVSDAIKKIEMGGGEILVENKDANARYFLMIKKYMALSEQDRDKTLLLEPSRAGRDKVNRLLRQSLIESGLLSGNGVKASSLKGLDLTREESKHVYNYQVGDMVKFGRDYKSHSIVKNTYWLIESVDPLNNVINIRDKDGREVIWNPSAWGAKSQIFKSRSIAVNVGEKIIWTCNNHNLGLKNGDALQVLAIDKQSYCMAVKRLDGKVFNLDLSLTDSHHWDYNYATTIHSAQGKTVDRVIYHAESFRRNLSSQKALYVALSRAKKEVVIVTDDREKLVEQVHEYKGQKDYAINNYEQEFELDI